MAAVASKPIIVEPSLREKAAFLSRLGDMMGVREVINILSFHVDLSMGQLEFVMSGVADHHETMAPGKLTERGEHIVTVAFNTAHRVAKDYMLSSPLLSLFIEEEFYKAFLDTPFETANELGLALKRTPHGTPEQRLHMAVIGQVLLDLMWQPTGIENGDAESARLGHKETVAWLGFVEQDELALEDFQIVCECAHLDFDRVMDMLFTFLTLNPGLGLVVDEKGEFAKPANKCRPRPATLDPRQDNLFDIAA